ncbi:metallophosphoesterase [Corynebacterium sp. CCM 9186]|uniref:bifunctional metallophosphatase/5'-nucleotidase n=1 Tax=Corynebacterium meridianum TaxID=2765363 RepID=UPI002006759B|nr:metallophosphoesterase [Corynebacterium meridianum]MCK7678079.1 metallophosphoesterase [Corynebacterium meridianum]
MNIHRHSRLSALTVGTLALSGLAVPTAGAEEVTPVTVNILATSDFHGRISVVHGRDGSLVDPGAAALACFIDAERDRNPDTNFVAAGDLISGSPFVSSILRDKPTLDAFNAMGLDVSALGNHEFDNGFGDVSARVSFDGTGQAKFPYIAANISGADPAPAPSYIVTTASGVRIAYVGGVTAETPSIVNPDGVVGLQFSEPVAAMNAEAERIAAADEADVIIGLVHERVHVNSGFSDAFDAVVAGHTHKETLETGPERAGRQPLVVSSPANTGACSPTSTSSSIPRPARSPPSPRRTTPPPTSGRSAAKPPTPRCSRSSPPPRRRPPRRGSVSSPPYRSPSCADGIPPTVTPAATGAWSPH